MLNSIINEDLLLEHSYGAINRTKLLLTFGSPLDKTAFLFRTNISNDFETREALATSMQPIIQSYFYRPKKWINVSSYFDIVSGKLDYYDWPAKGNTQAAKIENQIDWKAWKPIFAHNQYWKTDKVKNAIYNAIFN